MWNIPNILTLGRIISIPLIFGIFYLPDSWIALPDRNFWAGIIFVVAAITDWFDGYLARVLGQTSPFGAFLDPVADKLMVATVLVLLLWLGRVDAFIAAIIIGREITISALREWMALLGQPESVAVSYIGKLKTAAQMVALPLLLHSGFLLWGWVDSYFWGTLLIYVAAILTLISMVFYLHRASPYLRWSTTNETMTEQGNEEDKEDKR